MKLLSIALASLFLTACQLPTKPSPTPEPIVKTVRELPPPAYTEDVAEPQPVDQTIGAKLDNRLEVIGALDTCRSQLQSIREWSIGLKTFDTARTPPSENATQGPQGPQAQPQP